ncbi:MAG: DUF4124 domain-containing protein [Desulfobacteraceae bacterium]|nr:DUF4124 domain-containing protein [Desulfobacteraceae bacterium]
MARRIIGILLLVFLVVPTSGNDVLAEIYRWRDQNGILHFSDTPPPDGLEDTDSGQAPPQSPSTSGFSDAAQQETAVSGGMLWKIGGLGVKQSYLLGTIHSEDPRVLNLPDSVTEAFNSADAFVMELEMNSNAVMAMGAAMLITGDRDLESLIGASDFNKAVSAMADYGIPASILNRMKPWVVMSMLSMPKPKTGEFLDLMLANRAKSQGKAVHGLESAEEQMSVFEGLSIEDQVSLLKATIQQLDDLPAMFDQLIRAYVANDLARISALAQSYNYGVDSNLVQRFMFRLNEERNYRMVDRMMSYLNTGNAFVAVGALHLAGESGIINQLRAKGLEVTPVP